MWFLFDRNAPLFAFILFAPSLGHEMHHLVTLNSIFNAPWAYYSGFCNIRCLTNHKI